MEMFFSNSGFTTNSLILVCGLSVVKYFFESESDKYGSSKTLFYYSIVINNRFGRATIKQSLSLLLPVGLVPLDLLDLLVE